MDSKHRIYILFLHTTKRLDRGFTSSPHRILLRKRKTKTAFYIKVGGKVSRPILKRAATRPERKGPFKEKALERGIGKEQTTNHGLGGKARQGGRFRGKELIRVWQSRLKEERNRPKSRLAGKEKQTDPGI